MCKLSIEDGMRGDTLIRDTALRDYFHDDTIPKGSDTLGQFLVGSSPSLKNILLERGALGGCFHTIQDSYAVGHCQRVLLNPEERTTKVLQPSVGTYFDLAGMTCKL